MRNAKRILVAGGSGFLGIHLCKALLQEGHQVVCLDNFSSGIRDSLGHLEVLQGLEILEQDFNNPVDVDVEVDEIYNMTTSPLSTHIDGTGKLLELGLRRRIRVLQTSTGEIRGNPPEQPPKADDFGKSKRGKAKVKLIGAREDRQCAEALCMDYHRQHDVEVKIARVFNAYGPHMQPNDGRVVSNFIIQALLNRPITIYGDGHQTRSFCYVDDLIAGIRTLMDSPHSVVGPVDLGNQAEYTMLELATQIIELTGSSSPVIFLPLPKDDPVRRRPGLDRTKCLLDWEPQVGLMEGLLRTIEYFDKLLRDSGHFATIRDLIPPQRHMARAIEAFPV
jgi:UDP-glucuronate decarboxylase